MWKVTVLLALLLPALPVLAGPQGDWQQLQSADAPGQIATWVREVSDSPIKEFRGEVVLPVGAIPVLALLADADALDRWVFQCRHAERLPDATRDRLYLTFDLPWPVANRDVVLENTMTLEGTTLHLRSRSLADVKPEQPGLVRIPRLDNRFLVTPLGMDRTRVVFRTFVDPGGVVPAWLSNFVATNAPLDTLRGMRELVQQEPWVEADLDDLPVLPGFRAMDLGAWLDQVVGEAD